MCDSCHYEKALLLVEEIMEVCNEINEQHWHKGVAMDFAESVANATLDIGEWIEQNKHLTDRQREALENMKAGAEKWIDNEDPTLD